MPRHRPVVGDRGSRRGQGDPPHVLHPHPAGRAEQRDHPGGRHCACPATVQGSRGTVHRLRRCRVGHPEPGRAARQRPKRLHSDVKQQDRPRLRRLDLPRHGQQDQPGREERSGLQGRLPHQGRRQRLRLQRDEQRRRRRQQGQGHPRLVCLRQRDQGRSSRRSGPWRAGLRGRLGIPLRLRHGPPARQAEPATNQDDLWVVTYAAFFVEFQKSGGENSYNGRLLDDYIVSGPGEETWCRDCGGAVVVRLSD